MATTEGVLNGSPLKAPAIEIVDLLSDAEDSAHEPAVAAENLHEEDDSSVDGKDDEWSLYEDALEGAADDGIVNGSKCWMHWLSSFYWRLKS